MSPLFIIMYSLVVYSAFEFLSKKFTIPKISLLLLLIPSLLMVYPAYVAIPIKVQEIKDSIEYVEGNIKDGDTVYVYYASSYAFMFYQDSNLSQISNLVVVGSKNRGENYKYNQELLDLKGKVWLIFSHVHGDEEKYIMDFLLNDGSKILDQKRYSGSRLYYITRGDK